MAVELDHFGRGVETFNPARGDLNPAQRGNDRITYCAYGKAGVHVAGAYSSKPIAVYGSGWLHHEKK